MRARIPLNRPADRVDPPSGANMTSIEIEAKYPLPDPRDLLDRLRRLGAEPLSRELERTVVLDRRSRRHARRGERVRLRTRTCLGDRPSRPVVTFKGPRLPGPFKQRAEIELAVECAASARRLLRALGYRRIFEFEKRRTAWRLDRATVVIDDLPLIGRFVEIEGPDAGVVAQTAAHLGLADRTPEARGYVRLLRTALRSAGRKCRRVCFGRQSPEASPESARRSATAA